MTYEHEQTVSEQEIVHLHNQSVAIDVHKEVIPAVELGLPSEDDQHRFGVVGEMTLSSSTDEPAYLALIRTINKKSGMAELFVTGIVKDDQGNKAIAGAWESISPDTKYTLGRAGVDDDSKPKISGTKLFGSDFPQTVSRAHLTLELSRDGELIIEDNSMNASDLHVNTIGQGGSVNITTQEVDSQAMIDRVPQHGEEAAAMLEQARIEKIQPKIDEIDTQIAQAEARLGSIKERFSDDDNHNLWQFAFHKHHQGVEQRSGRADAAKAHEQAAGKAYKALPPEVQTASDEYRHALDEKTVLITRRAGLLLK